MPGCWRGAGHSVALADENFNDVLRALFRRDPTLLSWAADARRVVLTHDVSTITAYAYDRVRAGDPMPGVFEVSCSMPISIVVADILLINECSPPEEWEGQVRYLPLR